MAPMKRPANVDADTLGKVSKALKTCTETYADMLAGMCEECLGVPKPERHEYQASVVGMIEETLGNMEASHKEQVEKLKAEVDECPGSKEKREAAAAAAEKELADLREAVSARKAELETETKAMGAAEHALQTAKKERKDGDAVLDAVEAKKKKIESVVTESLNFLKEHAVRADNKALKAVLKLGKDLGFDHTMLTILPELAKKQKEARSDFDNLSMQNIDAEFAKHVEGLSNTLKEGEPGRVARTEAVDSSLTALEEARKKKADLEAAVEAAKSAEKAGATALKEAQKAVASWLADSKKTMDSYDEAVSAQTAFACVLSAFAELKEFEPPAPPAEDAPATEEPAAEAPAVAAPTGEPAA